MLRKWDQLPDYMQTDAVRPYYEKLKKKQLSLIFKRIFDIVVSLLLIVVFSPVLIIISILIVSDSKGGVFIAKSESRSMERNSKFSNFVLW